MLNATELNNIITAAAAELEMLENPITVISDEDVSKHIRNLSSTDQKISIIGVLPSFSLEAQDEDNFEHNNPLMIFLVKKHDINSGQDKFLKVYDDAGAAVLAFQEWIFKKRDQFPCPEFFKDIDLNSLHGDPVRDYHGLYGYMLQFEVNN